MRNPFHPITLATLLLATSTLTTACFGDEDESLTLSNESGITAATLGTLKRTLTTRTKDGLRDSSYTVSVTGTLYPLTIDHEQGRIYNVDSLPYGTDVRHVVLSKFIHTGGVAIRSLKTEKDTIFTLKDSTDYSRPRQFTTFSQDGKYKRHYTMELRVHQQEGDSTHWQMMSPQAWQEQHYVAPTSGMFKSSTLWWKVQGTQLLRSTDGKTWTPEALEAQEAQELPTHNIVGASRPARGNAQLEDLLLYGTKEGKSRVWKGTIDLTGTYALGWMYLPDTEENTLPAPVVTQAHLLAYDDGFLLLGVDKSKRAAILRYSVDRGRTWKQHPSLRLPAFHVKSIATLEALVDAQQHLWLRVNGQELWRGHINRLLWQQGQNVFLRAPQR